LDRLPQPDWPTDTPASEPRPASEPERGGALGGRHAAAGPVARPGPASRASGRSAAGGAGGRGRHAAGRPGDPGRANGDALGRGGPGRGEEGNGFPGAGEMASPAGPPAAGRLLRFASERKCLAGPGELTALDPDALRHYLAFQYVPPPEALTPPIRVLPPGHAMIARPGGNVDVYRYWRADLRPARTPDPTTPARILAVMRDSVAVHLRSDAPLGAFLSGGIDSAAICALAAEHRPDLLTFTVGFEREGYSEIDRAQETAAALGVKSIPYVISPEEFFHFLPQI